MSASGCGCGARLLGMSQERLGELLGLTFQQVQKYERGANRIGSSRLFELGRILDVPVSYFFDDLPAVDGRRPAAMRPRGWPRSAPPSSTPRGAAARQARDPGAGSRLQPDRRPAVRRRLFELTKALANLTASHDRAET